jgi:AraC-like DNA-binding protein
LEPRYGAGDLSARLDIPLSCIYRWRKKDAGRARQESMDEKSLAALIAQCDALGFPFDARRRGKAPTRKRGPISASARTARLTPEPDARDSIARCEEQFPLHVERRLQAARQTIDAQYFLELNCRDLAKVAGMSAFHFIRVFNERFGISPYKYLVKVRIEAAKRLLLRSSEPIEVVAAGTGFRSGPSLSRAFRRTQGTSVLEFCEAARAGTRSRESEVFSLRNSPTGI